MAWQERWLTDKLEVKRDRGQTGGRRAHTQARPSPKKKRGAKNEDPTTYPCHKRLRMSSRMCSKDQTNPQAMANA